MMTVWGTVKGWEFLTFHNDCSLVIDVRRQQVGILGRDDGVLRAAAINRTFPMSKLIQVLTDVP